MKIIIESIPHAEQRYPTVGDWFWADRNTLYIRVSRMSNWKHEAAVAIHELTEALWCKAAGVDEKDVTRFDLQFEKDRKEGVVGLEDEPGDCSDAPYYEGHQSATRIEKQAFNEWCWAEYDREVVNL